MGMLHLGVQAAEIFGFAEAFDDARVVAARFVAFDAVKLRQKLQKVNGGGEWEGRERGVGTALGGILLMRTTRRARAFLRGRWGRTALKF
jgi:hypothetical protein